MVLSGNYKIEYIGFKFPINVRCANLQRLEQIFQAKSELTDKEEQKNGISENSKRKLTSTIRILKYMPSTMAASFQLENFIIS